MLLHALPTTAGAFSPVDAFFMVFLRRRHRAQAQGDQRQALAELNRRVEGEMAGRRGVGRGGTTFTVTIPDRPVDPAPDDPPANAS